MSNRIRDSLPRIQKGAKKALNEVVALILTTLIWAIVAVTFFAVLFWIIAFAGERDSTYPVGTPFTLAQVAAIFGGFGLVAGFSGHRDSDLRQKMRLVGVLYILSALGFSLMGMLLPLSDSFSTGSSGLTSLIGWILAIDFSVVIISFTVGTFIWLSLVKRLIGEDKPDIETGCSPSPR